jgi:eukaryotic-like serine/threonine-protein kinase
MPLEPGQKLSHYRLVEKIGEGGMGVVWKAVDTNLDREVAIKVLPEALASDPQRLERFEREAKLLASLNHARIASLFGLHQIQDTRFLSMELIHGEDLAQRLKRGPMPVDESLRAAVQVAEGLEAAHQSGIIHRDLKPGNIKLTASGDVKILDFGLAKALQQPVSGDPADLSQSPTMTAAATQAGVILGTAAYMSPEQSRAQEADRRTDVWAFGCVLYEMLTGRGVFHGPTASDCIAGILEREPDWEALPAATPAAVRRLLRRCLEKDPRQRLHDIADARIELEEAVGGGGEETGIAESPARTGIGSRIAWAIAGVVLGAVATALVLSNRRPPEAGLHRSPGRWAVPLPSEMPSVPDPATCSLAISADGAVLVYVGLEAGAETSGGLGGDNPRSISGFRTQLFLRRMDDYTVRAIDGTRGAHSPFLSPDGEWVGFIDSHDGKLKKVRLQGGVPVTLSEEARGTDFRGFDWSEDGRIYFGGAVSGIETVPEDGGPVETLTELDQDRSEKTHRFPHVLPEGRGLLFTLATAGISSYDEASVALLDLRTGEHRILFDGGTDPSYVASGHIAYARSGTLEAVPFDLESLEVTGPPFQIAEGVVTSDGWGSAHYAVSDTGTLVYVPGGPELFQLQVQWLYRDGRVETVPLPPRPYGTASFSPDGKRLALSVLGANASIWIYDIERRTRTRLTSEWDNTAPTWMRSGTHVTFISNRISNPGIWRVAVDGSGEAELLHTDGIPNSWSAGDRWLTFSRTGPSTGQDIWLLTNDEGLRAEPLLQTAFHESFASFSPDGNWLAYTSNDSGVSELYVQRFPLSGRKWQISAGGGETPLWSPQGDALYYWKGNRLMTVPVVTEPDFTPGKEQELLQPQFSYLGGWDIAPDGERFVVVGSVEPTGRSGSGAQAQVRELRVVVDWFEEFGRGP